MTCFKNITTGNNSSIVTAGNGSYNGGDVSIIAGDASGSAGFVTVGRKKDTTTVVKPIKRWKRIICWLLGHKTEFLHNALYFNIADKTYRREFFVCERCGIFHKDTVSYEVPLTEDEKIIKDIIT